jgi:hypothetical protein
MILVEDETRRRTALNLAPNGRNKSAQGDALGFVQTIIRKPVKGETASCPCAALYGLVERLTS